MLPTSLLSFILLALPAVAYGSPSPALVAEEYWHLMPRGVPFLFPRQDGQNLQIFTGTLGAAAPAITASGNSKQAFSVNGENMADFQAASSRSCSNQFDACQKAANGAGGQAKAGFSVQDCTDQQTSCNAALSAAPVKAFSSSGTTTTLQNIGPDKANPDFDLFCEQ